MSGRIENDLKIKNKIEEILKDNPRYLKDYYNNIWEKTYSTKRVYIANIARFLKYLDANTSLNINHIKDVCRVKTSTINAYLGTIDAKGSAKAQHYYAIKNFFDFLVKDDRIENNPCDKIEPPKNKELRDIVYLTKDEVKLVQNNILNRKIQKKDGLSSSKWQQRDYLLIALGISTGLRVSSLVEIDIDDINFDDNYIDVYQKGNKEFHAPVSDTILELISEWLPERQEMLADVPNATRALFISSRKKRMSVSSVRNIVKMYSKGINKNITPHKMRSTCVTNIIKHTGNVWLAGHQVGHTNIETTNAYYAAMDKEMEKEATDAMDDLLFE